MTIYEDHKQREVFACNLLKQLDEHDKTQKEVADAIGVSTQTFNTWCRAIAIPRMGKIQKLADYFNITVTELIDEQVSPASASYYYDQKTAEMAQQIFESKELRGLFDAARDADPEDLKAVHDMLLALKRKERRYDDDGC